MSKTHNGTPHYKDYVAGWLDSSIHEFMEHFPRTSTRMTFALITCLDSNLDPMSLLSKSPELKSLARDVKPVRKAILLPTERLLDAGSQLFFGFDEVWFFPSEKIKPKPESAWLVGPKRIDQAKLDKLGHWMADNDCSLALGDGDGLNLIVKARGLVRYLIGYSMGQSQPATAGKVTES